MSPWRYWIGASHLSGGTYRPCVVLREAGGFSTEYLGTAGVAAANSYFHGLDVLDNALNPYAVGVFSSPNWIRVLTRSGAGVWGTSANLTLAKHANGIYIRDTNDVMILAHNVANGRDGLYHWDGSTLTYILQLSTAAPFINDGTHRGCLIGIGRGADCAMFAIGSMGNGVSVGKFLPTGLDPTVAGNWQTIAHPNYSTFVADSGYMVSESEIYVGQRGLANYSHPMVVRWNGAGWVSLGRHTSDLTTSQTAGALTMDPSGVLHAHFRWTSGGVIVRGVCKYVGGAWVDVYVHDGTRQMVSGKDVRDGVLAWCGLTITGDLSGRVIEIRDSGATEINLGTVLPAVSFKSAGALSPAAPDPPPIYSSIGVDRIFIVQEFILRVDFSGELAITPELIDPATFSITPTRPVGDVAVMGVLPPDGTVTDKIFLQVRGLKLDQYYSLDIPGDTLRDRTGRALSPIQFTWRMRRTKMDVTTAGLPKVYDTRERTTVTGILEAIMISDEEIGGDF